MPIGDLVGQGPVSSRLRHLVVTERIPLPSLSADPPVPGRRLLHLPWRGHCSALATVHRFRASRAIIAIAPGT